jgi:hypothetical protein
MGKTTDQHRQRQLPPVRLIVLFLGLALALPLSSIDARGPKTKDRMRFAAAMAEKGNWREARYRWEIIARDQPDNGRVLNNLAVAAEVLGRFDEAEELYDKALSLSGDDEYVGDNRRRLEWFLKQSGASDNGEGRDDNGRPPRPPIAASGGKGGKPIRVSVGVPIPPRLTLDNISSLLVASFRTQDSTLLDINRELVRFIRSEFSKKTDLEVLDVVPPPAIPEQTIEDLLANREFWKYLSREHGADLIISGVVIYGREDISGFEDVDYVSSNTGQKVRQTRFVERERFEYALDIFFMDGRSGELLHRDRMSRSLLFRGQLNDPITAFYELNESMAADVLAVVVPRRRQESRYIFKK